VLTTSTKDTAELELSLKNTEPLLGPPLKFNIYINDSLIDTGELVENYLLSKKIPVRHGDNFVIIEHPQRHDENTQLDTAGNLMKTSMIEVVGLWINKIKFRCDQWNERNTFELKYDDSYLDWARKHRPNTNFPDEKTPDKYIGNTGKAKVYFMWPLHVHGLYYRLYHGG
jgi:hypothetical protein